MDIGRESGMIGEMTMPRVLAVQREYNDFFIVVFCFQTKQINKQFNDIRCSYRRDHCNHNHSHNHQN